MAEFRIDQPGGAGSGVAGESRVDLLPGFVVELHATPVAGATFTWEILDKVNAPVAFLTGTTGLTVNIGSAGVDIPAFCGFMVRLTQNLLGVITVQDRVAAVRSAVAQIRPPLFGEQSPSVQTLNANNPALSTDNAVYPDLAGLGVPGNNPFGWREWAWEIAKALETTAAVVGTPAPIKISGASRQILSIIGSETVIGSFGAFDPTVYADPVLLLEATFVFVPATAGSIEVRLYDMGTRLSPGAGILRSTITATFADVGVLKCISQTLAVTPGPGVNVDEIDPSEVIYEVRAILIGANPGDELELGAVHLVVAPSIGGGGMAAPNSPSFLTLGAAAGLLAERVFTPQKSVVGIDGGAGAAYAVELDGDVAAPGNDMAYSTDGTGAKGWFPKAASDVIWEWNGVDTTQFAASNPLPAPALPGTAVGATLTAVASPQVPGGAALTVDVASFSAAGGAVWWIDQPLPLNRRFRVEAEFGVPLPTPSSGESTIIGVVFGGDTAGFVLASTLEVRDDGFGNTTYIRRVVQYDPVGPNNVILLEDTTFGGYLAGMVVRVHLDRGDTSYAGPPGVPRGTIITEHTAWVPPPTTNYAVGGSVAIANSAFLPPGPAWATSSCDRIGIMLAGNSTTPLQTGFYGLRFLAD